MKNSIHAEAPTLLSKKNIRNLSYAQWAVYYLLLSRSRFNAEEREDHRYLYARDFTKTGIGEEIGVSRQTVHNAINKLIEVGLIQYDKKNKWYLIYSRSWVSVDFCVLITLLEFAKKSHGRIDILRIYLCLKKVNTLAVTAQDRKFTITDLMDVLGHNKKDQPIRENTRDILALLSYLNLIEFTTSQGYDEQRGRYTIYYLKKVNSTTNHPDFNSSLAAEIESRILPERIKKEIEFIHGECE